MKYADIIIDISHERLDKSFQYIIPPGLEEQVAVGDRAVIPFGNGNRAITGYIVGISEEPKLDPSRLKPIARILKDSIPIESQMIALAAWMKRNYGSTMNQALKTVIPIKKKESEKLRKTVSLAISKEQAKVELTELCSRKRHSLGKERLLFELIENDKLDWELITQKLQVPSSDIRDLEKKAIVRVEQQRQFRNPVAVKGADRKPVALNEYQRAAVEKVIGQYDLDLRKTYLVHGVTGSGKTEVYMEIMAHVLEKGKQVIVLIPEIALTYQTVMRFYGRFGDQVSILNSRMSPGERFDQFERAKAGEISVMVGPRSALFTPFLNLGLIIIDEEHESSYKSEVIPKYHARETAIERARLAGASVVLGSATPSLEAFSKAKNGEYELLELPERVSERAMAQCHIVDLRKELAEGNRSILSRQLQTAIRDRLDKKQQVMLFLNRRGLMGALSCRACGTVVKCPHCDVSLSLHNDSRLHCHYCGYIAPKPVVCPKCQSKYIGTMKAGTQKVEEVIKQLYPDARILRMDSDTTKGKDGHEEILSSFASGEADILIGTQMIVKGHDFARVTLVGIIVADISLNDSDYHSTERTFQLLTQAVGRAGRGQLPGEAIIQTYQPENFAVISAAAQDYVSFFNTEMAYRKLLSYPPSSHILMLQITGEVKRDADGQATVLTELIKTTDPTIQILGPADANIGRINDVYRKVVYIKDKDYERLIAVKDVIEKFLLEQKQYRNTNTWFDFDPISGF